MLTILMLVLKAQPLHVLAPLRLENKAFWGLPQKVNDRIFFEENFMFFFEKKSNFLWHYYRLQFITIIRPHLSPLHYTIANMERRIPL